MSVESPAAAACRALFNEARLLAGEPLLPPGAVATMTNEEFARDMAASANMPPAVRELPVSFADRVAVGGGTITPEAIQLLARLGLIS